MRKTENTIDLKIVTYGGGVIPVTVKEGATVGDALEEAGVEVGTSDKIFVESVEAELNDEPEAGDILTIVGSKSGGLK